MESTKEGVAMKKSRQHHRRRFLAVILALSFSLSGCKSAKTASQEKLQLYSALLYKPTDGRFMLYSSEDGGLWSYCVRLKDEPEKIRAYRWGPVFLPETDDVGKTFSLHITGIRKYVPSPTKEWWYLDHSIDMPNLAHQKSYARLLLIELDGHWYWLPQDSGYSHDAYDPASDTISEDGKTVRCLCSKNLLAGETSESQQVIPGHYRFLIFRQWNGKTALDVEEFDLLEIEDGYAIDNIRKPTSEELFAQEAWIPSRNIRDLDGRAWHMSEAEADRLYFVQDSNKPVDILETEETPVPIVVVE